jgi:hypothetical protein
VTYRASELSAHRDWALTERRQTDGILYAFLASRMSEEKALAWMIHSARSYPALPDNPEILESRNEV